MCSTPESAAVSDFLHQSKIITQEVTQEEINKATSRLKANKTPGADGDPLEYKT